jgi:hypothetical protein
MPPHLLDVIVIEISFLTILLEPMYTLWHVYFFIFFQNISLILLCLSCKKNFKVKTTRPRVARPNKLSTWCRADAFLRSVSSCDVKIQYCEGCLQSSECPGAEATFHQKDSWRVQFEFDEGVLLWAPLRWDADCGEEIDAKEVWPLWYTCSDAGVFGWDFKRISCSNALCTVHI